MPKRRFSSDRRHSSMFKCHTRRPITGPASRRSIASRACQSTRIFSAEAVAWDLLKALRRNQSGLACWCLILRSGGTIDHHSVREALSARFFTAAPLRRRQPVARSSYVKRA